MLKKSKTFLVWFLVIVFAVGLLGSTTLISLFGPKRNLSTRELAFSCTTDEATRFHIHPLLAIVAEGKNVEIPADVGESLTCLHPLHTHDNTGTIHVEAPEERDFTLGDFFAVWEKPLSKTQVLDYVADASHTLVMTVDGKPNEEFENLVLRDNEKIIIEYKKITNNK